MSTLLRIFRSPLFPPQVTRLTCTPLRGSQAPHKERKGKKKGSRRQGGGGWGTPLKKRSATQKSNQHSTKNSVLNYCMRQKKPWHVHETSSAGLIFSKPSSIKVVFWIRASFA